MCFLIDAKKQCVSQITHTRAHLCIGQDVRKGPQQTCDHVKLAQPFEAAHIPLNEGHLI